MHRRMRDEVERVLAGTSGTGSSGDDASNHLTECAECREQIEGMRAQAALLRSLRAPETAEGSPLEPRAGFYARVMERIEAQGGESIWNVFFDSPLGRRVAMASMALAVCLSVYLVSSEQIAGRTAAAPASGSGSVVLANLPDQDAVLVNLVTYRGQ